MLTCARKKNPVASAALLKHKVHVHKYILSTSTTVILPKVTIMKPKVELDTCSYTSNETNPQENMEDSDEKEPMPLL